MLKKENRLKKEKDFEAVFEKGKGFRAGLLSMRIAKNDSDLTRFGFIVSKKYSKKASERNKIKRRLREISRKFAPEVKNGLDVIIIVMPGLENDFESLSAATRELFEKSKILKK